MKPVGQILRTRPVVSILILAALLAIMTSGTADVRSSETDVVLIGVALVLMVYGTLSALVLFPRSSHATEDQIAVVQWAEAIAIYLIGWLGWFLFGLPSWLVVVGAVVAMTVLLVSIARNRRTEGD
jgi:hypothetical protein